MKMKPVVISICCACLALLQLTSRAQTAAGTEQLMAELKKVQSYYYAHPLSFRVKYIYAAENAPDKPLDSLSGRMEVSGSNFHYWLDSTETIRNDRYSIVLFKEDRIMYLAKPSANAAAPDPLQLMQAALEKAGLSNCEVTVSGRNKEFRMFFKPGAPYRQMDMTIDTLSGYMQSMRYVVKTAMLMEVQDSDQARLQGYDEYSIVQASFEHYRRIPDDPARFNEQTFFYKEGNEYVTTQAYKDYKIFVGTPNL
jgi:hypothetical protein